MKKLKQFLINLYWRAFIWLDYLVRYGKSLKSIELTDRKDLVRIDGALCGFYSKEFEHYEICEEDTDTFDWKGYYANQRMKLEGNQ